MVPGMMCDERIFSPQIEALSQNLEVTIADISGIFQTVQGVGLRCVKKGSKNLFTLRAFNGWHCCYGNLFSRA